MYQVNYYGLKYTTNILQYMTYYMYINIVQIYFAHT